MKIRRFKSLPIKTRRLMGLGVVLALVVALPLFVNAVATQTFNLRGRAQENPPTNACGGTCGSIYNCNVNLFCYQGFCRNPDCPNDLTCGCVATPTPSSLPTKKQTAKPAPTSEIVFLTPRPVGTPIGLAVVPPTPPPVFSFPTETAAATATPAPQTENFGYLLWISGGTFATAIILMLFAL